MIRRLHILRVLLRQNNVKKHPIYDKVERKLQKYFVALYNW